MSLLDDVNASRVFPMQNSVVGTWAEWWGERH
jgi:hypothetical protein